MLGYALTNVAHKEVIGVSTVGRYDICPFNKLFVNLLPSYTNSVVSRDWVVVLLKRKIMHIIKLWMGKTKENDTPSSPTSN